MPPVYGTPEGLVFDHGQYQPSDPLQMVCLLHRQVGSMRYAFDMGYKTSVSAEPMLYSYDIESLIDAVSPYCNESIWLGLMNHLENILELHPHVSGLKDAIEFISGSQTYPVLKAIYDKYKENRLIKYKSHFKDVVGI